MSNPRDDIRTLIDDAIRSRVFPGAAIEIGDRSGVRVREELVAQGRAMPHHILPQSGWVSYPIRDASAIPGALDLFRLAYERATAKQGKND